MEPVSKEQQREIYLQWFNNALQIQQGSIQQSQVQNAPEDIVRYNWLEFFEESSRLYNRKMPSKYVVPTKPVPLGDSIAQEAVEAPEEPEEELSPAELGELKARGPLGVGGLDG
jgi:hypothetical protein